ncbi:uncharacterized protein [Diadema antillarum]|uniref:uncharacterized protein n=1 Tax=Diadema antillarum TaxID=105358 RepID=UPI003A8B807C
MEKLLQTMILISLAFYAWCEENDCSRIKSRTAYSILEKSFLSIMEKEGLQPGPECPLKQDRNMYWDNERHKASEASNNWQCLYCAKAFYSERFLDNHFVNKHPNTVFRGANAVCLADHCDYLRCDVISESKKSSYWEEALCKQRELEDLNKKCQSIMKMCIPPQVTGTDRYELLEEMKTAVCSYLTCDKYWENPYSEPSPRVTAAYIVATVFMVFGFIMYYTMACAHLYYDDGVLADSDGLVRHKSRLHDSRRYVSRPPPEGQSIRSRQGLVAGR